MNRCGGGPLGFKSRCSPLLANAVIDAVNLRRQKGVGTRKLRHRPPHFPRSSRPPCGALSGVARPTAAGVSHCVAQSTQRIMSGPVLPGTRRTFRRWQLGQDSGIDGVLDHVERLEGAGAGEGPRLTTEERRLCRLAPLDGQEAGHLQIHPVLPVPLSLTQKQVVVRVQSVRW